MFQKAYRIYCRAQEILVGSFFVAIVGLTFVNAVLRTLDRPIPTTDDVCMLLFAWSALLGADIALRYSRLVGMDILVSKFSAKWQKFFQILAYLIMVAGMILFIQFGFELAIDNWKRFFNTLPISYGWVTLSLPVACCMMVFTAILKVFKVATRFNDDSYNVRKDNPDLVGEEFTTGLEDAAVNAGGEK